MKSNSEFRQFCLKYTLIPMLLLCLNCYACYAIYRAPSFDLLILRLPQIGAGALFSLSLATILTAAKRHKLGDWKTYLPLASFIVFVVLALALTPIWAEFAMREKLTNAEGGETWCEGMAGRVLGGWPTSSHCALSDQVAVLIWYWSFVTLDGRMPVLAWSQGGAPSPDLPTQPTSCKQLAPQWFFCYLSKPGQLRYDSIGLCDLR